MNLGYNKFASISTTLSSVTTTPTDTDAAAYTVTNIGSVSMCNNMLGGTLGYSQSYIGHSKGTLAGAVNISANTCMGAFTYYYNTGACSVTCTNPVASATNTRTLTLSHVSFKNQNLVNNIVRTNDYITGTGIPANTYVTNVGNLSGANVVVTLS
jgi:hypothetical protein